jgi:aspartyl-tRNA(Asn)/glutamyl-tRNA(Gln) amidotransferase subunit B
MGEKMEIKIGLETHLQLLSKSKLFCGCPTEGPEGEGPNTRTCDTCLGLPGSKPRVNKKVIEMGLKIAKALKAEVSGTIQFSRKSYFYPDMSKNFQITQYEIPLAKRGELRVDFGDHSRTIRIRRLNIEEDPAKLFHVGGSITSAKYVLVDYNRSGTPLVEIVTEPDLKNPREARIFLQKLATVLEYLGVYEATSEASIKSDINVSIKGGKRVEMKNVTGFREAERALNYEIARQKNVLRRGRKVEMETRAWDAEAGVTRILRKKEEEEDYGYIFEPDLVRNIIPKEKLKKIEKELPELPDDKLKRYMKEFGLNKEMTFSIVEDFELTQLFEKLVKKAKPDLLANVIVGYLKKTLNFNNLRFSQTGLETKHILKLIRMIEKGKITERNAELLLRDMILKPQDPEKLAKKKDMLKISVKEITHIIEDVLKENSQAVSDYKEGKKEALNFLVGKVLQKTRDKVEPKEVRKIVEEKLR